MRYAHRTILACSMLMGAVPAANAVEPPNGETSSALMQRLGQWKQKLRTRQSAEPAIDHSSTNIKASSPTGEATGATQTAPGIEPEVIPDGFHRLERRKTTPSIQQLTNDDLFAGLSKEGWVKSAHPDDDPLNPDCPWHHPHITELVTRALASPTIREEIETRLREALAKRSGPVLKFHAAVTLHQLQHSVPLDLFNSRALDVKVPVTERVGAIFLLADSPENLDAARLGTLFDAWFPEPAPTTPTEEMNADSGQFRDTHGLNPASLLRDDPALVSAILWAYIRSAMRQPGFDASQDLRVARAANYGDDSARRIAATAFASQSWQAIPRPLTKLLADSVPLVRRTAVKALASHPAPMTADKILMATFDQDPGVRVDAIDALANLPGQATNRRLDELAGSENPVDRQAMIRVARVLKLDYLIRSAANDPEWTVRKEAAIALGDPRLGPVVETLRRLLHDRSPEVQLAAIDSFAKLSLKDAVTGLLEGLASTSRSTRERAARRITKLWSEADGFAIDAPPNEREEAIRQLQDRWRKQRTELTATDAGRLPSTPEYATGDHQDVGKLVLAWYRPETSPAQKLAFAKEIVAQGSGVVPAIEAFFEQHDSYPSEELLRMVLAEIDPIYRELALLWAKPRQVPLTPISHLESALLERKLTKIQAVLITELLGRSHAPTIWMKLLPIVERDFPADVLALDGDGLRHPDPLVREATCRRILPRVKVEDGPALLRLFSDDILAVRVAAIEAAGHIQDEALLPEFRRVLVNREPEIRLAAAVALHRHQDPSGAQELWRLGRDSDPTIRRKVMQEVASLAKVDPDGAARLFAEGLKDEKPSVKEQAVQGLESLMGQNFQRDKFGRPIAIQDQILRWNQLMGTGTTRSPLIPLTLIENEP